jgi:intracellular sulfur oxidation DsrE/DsrF family protein
MKSILLFVGGILFSISVWSQTKQAGPIIKDYGAVWNVADTDYSTNTKGDFMVVFDIMNSPADTTQQNASIETAARFLNMHAQNGVPAEQMKVALVVHNKASKDLITDIAYKKRYGVENPNSEMINQLLEANVAIIFCGQSSLSRNFPKQDLIPGVQLSLSAMTALIQLQNEGYTFIKF